MKRFSCWLLLSLLLVSSALAVPSVTVTQTPGTHPATPLSGEFTLTPNDDLAALIGQSGSFQSFCVELFEGVVVGNTYEVVVNDEAILGDGLGGDSPGPDGGDPLSPATAYLYSLFLDGALPGYPSTPGTARENAARSLQTAIWYLEGEMGSSGLSPQAQGFVAIAEDTPWSTIGDVRILNLYTNALGKLYNQDMLVRLAPVPVPGAIILGSIGVGLVGWMRRRRAL